MYTLMFLGAITGTALAQSAISFSNTTFTAPVTVGSTWPISFTAGNGEPVAIAFGNSSYAFQIVDGLSAPGTYSWPVAVPVNVVNGNYQLALLQGDEDPVFSPAFSLVIPPEDAASTTDAPTTTVPFPTTETVTTTVTAIYLPTGNATSPMVTYIYWEEACGCHHTSTCAPEAMPTSLSTTTVTYSAHECGCTTTIEAPFAETVIPVVAAAATAAPTATNTPVAPSSAPPTAPAPMAPTSTQSVLPAYTGAAEKLAGSSFGFLVMVAALVMA